MKLAVNDDNFGRYEKRLCVLLLLATIPNAFPALQALVTQYTPSHHCDVLKMLNVSEHEAMALDMNGSNWKEELLNLTIPWEVDSLGKATRSQCSMFNVTRLQLFDMIKDPKVNRSTTIVPCNSIEYVDGRAVSAVTEFGMVCDRAWQKPLTTSAYMVGLMVGGVIGGMISDAFGRKISFLFFTYLQFIVVFASSFVNDVVTHGIVMFFAGAAALVNFVSAVVLGAEFLPSGARTFSYLAVEVGFSIGSMLFAPLAYAFSNWRWYLRCTGLVGLLYIPYTWLIDESPEWLETSGKKDEATKVLQKVAKFNHKQLKNPDKTLLSGRNGVKQEQTRVKSTLKELATTPRMLRRFLIVLFSWFIVSISYYTMKLNMNKLTGDRFWNIFFGGVTELLATFIFYFAVETRGRRQSYMISMAATAVSIVVASLLSPYSGSVATALAMASQLLISVAYNVIYVYTGELFPTKSRQSMLGLNAMGSRVGGFVAPYLIYAGDSGSTVAPSLGNAGALLLSVVTYAFLPETRRVELPTNVREALDLPGGHVVKTCKDGLNKKRKQSRNENVSGEEVQL